MATNVVVKDLLPAPKVLTINEKKVPVRGLTMKEITVFLQTNADPLKAFFASKDFDFTLLLATTPEMCVQIIACGIDAKGQEEDIEALPASIQIDMLTDIWELSVPNVRKLLASLGRAAELLKVAQPVMLPQPSNNQSP